ncbi:MAG: tRNA pseudouridine synthase [Bacteroidetes bacterium]|nr:tRNA pseudouridine synthase [Bacteroidota bacterium]
MQRYFIRLSYNGIAYHGWQVQENTFSTVQQVVNDMLSMVLNEPIFATGCGRTDAGVHATDFYAHFDTANAELLENKGKWIFKFNGALPADVAIHDIFAVHGEANARFDAVSRTYEYVVSKKKDPFRIDRACFYNGVLDVAAMNKAALELFNYTDFSSFAKINPQNFTNNCKVFKAEWKEENDVLIFRISADRFLRNMVRAIVGTLMDVGKGKLSLEGFKEIIESKNRSNAGYSVPAGGLYLVGVAYPEHFFTTQRNNPVAERL